MVSDQVRRRCLDSRIGTDQPRSKGSKCPEHYVSVKIEGAGLDTQFG